MKEIKVFSKKNEILVHILMWSLALLIVTTKFSVRETINLKFVAPLLFQFTFYLTFIITFYYHYLVTLSFSLRSAVTWKKFLVGTVLSISIFISTRAFLEQFLTYRLFGAQNYFADVSSYQYIIENIIYAIWPIFFATMLWLIIRYIRVNQLNQIYYIENQLAEMKFLKSQLNPHAIFNTLNNIYALVYMKSPMALVAIEKLGNIIRFTTYQATKEWICIETELAYIEDLIALEKFRYKDDFFVHLNTNVDDKQFLIQPFIIIPLVENALKHGVLNDENKPVTINIELSFSTLKVTVTNAVRKGNKDTTGGVGIENLNRRLAINTDQKYQLTQHEEMGVFTISLHLNGK